MDPKNWTTVQGESCNLKGGQMTRKKYSSEFKSLLALEALMGQRTLNENASEYGVHPGQISRWKQQLKNALPDIFSRNGSKSNVDKEKLEARLYQEIGRLKVELDWLEKKG
jgi:transposase-like protein